MVLCVVLTFTNPAPMALWTQMPLLSTVTDLTIYSLLLSRSSLRLHRLPNKAFLTLSLYTIVQRDPFNYQTKGQVPIVTHSTIGATKWMGYKLTKIVIKWMGFPKNNHLYFMHSFRECTQYGDYFYMKSDTSTLWKFSQWISLFVEVFWFYYIGRESILLLAHTIGLTNSFS